MILSLDAEFLGAKGNLFGSPFLEERAKVRLSVNAAAF